MRLFCPSVERKELQQNVIQNAKNVRNIIQAPISIYFLDRLQCIITRGTVFVSDSR